MIDERRSNICKTCCTVVKEFTKIKRRMTSIQKGFIKYTKENGENEDPEKIEELAPEEEEQPAFKKQKLEETHSCKICFKRFNTKHGVQKHITLVHETLRNHHCDICEFTTNNETNLRYHVRRRHIAGPGKVQCRDCGWFVDCGSLSNHRGRMHGKANADENGKFPCNICDRLFGSKPAVRKHIGTVHLKLRNFYCDHCDYSSYSKDSILSHMRSYHIQHADDSDDGKIRIKCPECPLLVNQRFLKRHIKLTHSANSSSRQIVEEEGN